MFYKNYKSLGEDKKANNFWVYPLIVYFAIRIVAFLDTEESLSPNFLLLATYVVVTYLFYTNKQSQLIKHYLENGHKPQNWIIVVLISLVCGALTPYTGVELKFW